MNEKPKAITCNLTTPELQERKRTDIATLKSFVREKKETEHGMQYKFEGADHLIDLVSAFIKTERLCCDFLTLQCSSVPMDRSGWSFPARKERSNLFLMRLDFNVIHERKAQPISVVAVEQWSAAG